MGKSISDGRSGRERYGPQYHLPNFLVQSAARDGAARARRTTAEAFMVYMGRGDDVELSERIINYLLLTRMSL